MVGNPSASITALFLLWIESRRVSVKKRGRFFHSSSSWAKFSLVFLPIRQHSSSVKFPNNFGIGLASLRGFTWWRKNQFWMCLDRCFRSLSFWKMKSWPREFSAYRCTVFWRMFSCWSLSIISWFYLRVLIPSWETHPQTITFQPPCFIVGIWYLVSKQVPRRQQIHCIPSVPSNMHLLSSLQRTYSHSLI